MPYTAPTYATFLAAFPEFVAVPQATIEYAITRSGENVDTTWREADYTEGRNLYTAHYLARKGLGTGPDAQAIAGGTAGFRSIRSGALSLDRGANYSTIPDSLGSTTYGRQYYELLMLNRGGPRVTGEFPAAGEGWYPTIPYYGP